MSHAQTTETAAPAASPLAKFSLRGSVEEVEKYVTGQGPLLGEIAARNQATCIYAEAGSGKTLLVLYLITESIASGILDADRVLYLNVDDNPNGLLEKCRLADEYGFHMLADGYMGFSLQQFHATLREMVASKTVNGAVLVLDTLKKFVDTMNKSEARKFTGIVRQFVALGGTVVALAHTNKNPDAMGNQVYAGTSDILDDFDCVYIVSKIRENANDSRAVAVFRNKKSRGSVADAAAYSFATGQLTYSELLASVSRVDPQKWVALCPTDDDQSDAALIAAVEDALRRGVNSKMLLASDVSSKTNVSRQKALRVIERYADPKLPQQRWTFVRGDRGRHHYTLIEQPSVDSDY